MTRLQNETLQDCIDATLTHFNAIDALCEMYPELEDVAQGLAITHSKLVELQRELQGRCPACGMAACVCVTDGSEQEGR